MYLLIGKQIEGSFSPFIHARLGASDYRLCQIDSEVELKALFLQAKADGYNVTMPYKRAAMCIMDELSPIAKRTGVVNTVAVTGGKLYGENTDYFGLKYAIEKTGYSLSGKTVLIAGGGASKDTASCLAKDLCAKRVDFVSRTGGINYENCYALADTQVVINTTPLGSWLYPDSSPFALEKFPSIEAAFDLTYNPLRPPLRLAAKRLGITYSSGLDTLVAQAHYSELVFKGDKELKNADNGLIARVIKETADFAANIILIGMPSCGKSAVGELVAKALGKTFVDTDAVFQKRHGETAGDYIKKFGEAAFRRDESAIIKELSSSVNSVVATGGGSVLGDGINSLIPNGFLVFLDRPIEKLSSSGRPLSAEKGISALYAARLPIYARLADATVQNDDSIDKCVKEIISLYEDRNNQRT